MRVSDSIGSTDGPWQFLSARRIMLDNARYYAVLCQRPAEKTATPRKRRSKNDRRPGRDHDQARGSMTSLSADRRPDPPCILRISVQAYVRRGVTKAALRLPQLACQRFFPSTSSSVLSASIIAASSTSPSGWVLYYPYRFWRCPASARYVISPSPCSDSSTDPACVT